jgi:hypothetical protein
MMVLDKKLSRRQLLRGVSGAAAVATLAPFSQAAAFAAPGDGRLIPAAKVGTITFTQRDVPTRLGMSTGSPTTGYLGGANFPEDPTDLGPLVPLPGGWKELLAYLAMIGFEQIEFAGYGQNAAIPICAGSRWTSTGPMWRSTSIAGAPTGRATGSRTSLIRSPRSRSSLRYPLYHAKDGDSTGEAPGVGQGYTMIPFGDPRSDIDFATFFRQQGAKGSHNPDHEQDNAPGGAADPGRSLRFSAISAHNMNALRG